MAHHHHHHLLLHHHHHHHDHQTFPPPTPPAPPPPTALPPLRLLGDNAADQLRLVLLDRTARQLHLLEHNANCALHAARWGETANGGVEGAVEMFREGRERIYERLEWEHGKRLAREVFDTLGAWDWVPRNRGRTLSWVRPRPAEGTSSESGCFDEGTVLGAEWGDISPNGEITIEMSGLHVWERDVDGVGNGLGLGARSHLEYCPEDENDLGLGRPNGSGREGVQFLV